jgi:hypothetical protein
MRFHKVPFNLGGFHVNIMQYAGVVPDFGVSAQLLRESCHNRAGSYAVLYHIFVLYIFPEQG